MNYQQHNLAVQIATCAEQGRIAVVESGRDCDGVRYSGEVRYIPATPEAYVDLDGRIGMWADGPYALTIMKPSEAAEIEYEARDLAAEAFENGHPYSLHVDEVDLPEELR